MTQAQEYNCPRCQDDRMIANSDDGEAWHHWMELPLQSAVAVTMGLVRPIPCPACNADGKAKYRECAHADSLQSGHNYCIDCGERLRGGYA